MLERGTVTNEDAVELATEFGKTVRSVRAKAVSLGIYHGGTQKNETNEPRETKQQIAAEIAEIVRESMNGLEKAPKDSLVILRKYMRG